MKKVSTGIAFLLAVFLSNATSEGLINGGALPQYQQAGQMFVAASGGNPWAVPAPRQQRGQLPEYITNPRYATQEDIQTKLNQSNSQQNTYGQPLQQQQFQQQQLQQQQLQQQQLQSGYGAGMGLPQLPYIYAPYSGMLYGNQPGYSTYPALPSYPGLGGVPGLGSPYMGNTTGFGGNPLLTPYGNIYGNGLPYQPTAPSVGVE
ncbi:MAG: hypothetical protein WBO16_17625 [Gammaproteobacteria bacterium]|jgi:hypothetical protein